jgi:hypothetical protein
MNWRTCKYCAAVRQHQACDKAQKLDQSFDQLYLSVIIPETKTAQALQRIRAAILRRAFAPAGIWSVETGEKMGGLHLNIIAPAPVRDGLAGCRTWAEAITTSARAAAAYINKPSGHPDPAEYSGHLNGSWSRVPDFFHGRGIAPVVAAASAEAALSQNMPVDYLRQALTAQALRASTAPKTRAEAYEIARRHLPNLYAITAGRQPGED